MNQQKSQPQLRTKIGWLTVLSCALCLMLLSGCVNYDVGVNFENSYRGSIVQKIKLGKQLTSFSQTEANAWLDSIERRAQQLQGKTERVSPQEVVVKIPFSDGQDLVSKFNTFFNPSEPVQLAQPDSLDVLQLDSQMSLQQSNLLLFQRNRLSLSVDLRALGVISEGGNLIVSPGSLIDLQFGLNTPLGARSKIRDELFTPETRVGEKQLLWQLQPGQINYIEAVFWLPNPLGIGTVAIALLVTFGFYSKYKRFPWLNKASQNLT